MKYFSQILIVIVLEALFFSCQKEMEETVIEQKMVAKVDLVSNKLQTPMALVSAGSYFPFYGKDSVQLSLDAFYMDIYPVTNNQFLEFVANNPTWRRSEIKSIFKESNYLIDWQNDTTLVENMDGESPVVNVSWFAANEYCKCQGKTLPTVDQWEYVAMANKELKDARTLEAYNQYILEWYETPNSYLRKVGSTFKNYWGIYDLHGLVWEWTSDFNSILIGGESRSNLESDKNLFCGSASVNATDLMNYAAFMRYSLRSSLKAKYTVRNVGFRCIKKAENETN